MKKLIILLALLTLGGCAMPEWRVFQRKVPVTMSEKPAKQIEGEKQGAALIREITTPPVQDAAVAVQKVHEVAISLSASLGEPAQPVKLEDQAAVIAALRNGLIAKEHQLEQWKAFGKKYGGMPLEGTGIDLAGPTGFIGLIAIVALCIAFPPIGYIILRALPVLWGYFRSSTTAISGFIAEHPDAGEQLKAKLSSKMDLAHKRLVKARA